MIVKNIVDESFGDYKKPSMYIAFPKCDWKCCIDVGKDASMCQNSKSYHLPDVDISIDEIYERYKNNPITSAVVLGGLEPLMSFLDVLLLVEKFRTSGCTDDIVIYTGYYPAEIKLQIEQLAKYKNIIMKFGRFKPDSDSVFDETLGVTLASSNQYAMRLEDIKW